MLFFFHTQIIYMKKDIHPNYSSDAKITCSCGAVFSTGSTSDNPQIETCSQCHPFFTGKQKIIDTTGRVDRFNRMSEESQKVAEARKNNKSKAEKQEERLRKQEERQEEAQTA